MAFARRFLAPALLGLVVLPSVSQAATKSKPRAKSSTTREARPAPVEITDTVRAYDSVGRDILVTFKSQATAFRLSHKRPGYAAHRARIDASRDKNETITIMVEPLTFEILNVK